MFFHEFAKTHPLFSKYAAKYGEHNTFAVLAACREFVVKFISQSTETERSDFWRTFGGLSAGDIALREAILRRNQ